MTAIVGAIRIGGPQWLKAVVGRARESKASAEVELTTSTSEDVCELWNGMTIVRIIGSPRILQLIDIPEKRDGPEYGLYTLDNEAKENGILTLENGTLTWDDWGSLHLNKIQKYRIISSSISLLSSLIFPLPSSSLLAFSKDATPSEGMSRKDHPPRNTRPKNPPIINTAQKKTL